VAASFAVNEAGHEEGEERAISRRRKQKRTGKADPGHARVSAEPRLPTELQRSFGDVGLEFAREKLRQRRWREAYEFAETSRAGNNEAASAIMAEASARSARSAALEGDFQAAQVWASRAVELRPHDLDYRRHERLIKTAAEAIVRDLGEPLFPDTVGPGRGRWWDYDLLGRVRGGSDGVATVPAPLILEQTARSVIQGVYAVGIYQPWHVGGPVPLFTQYIRALKPGGTTIPYAAILLRQGLTAETDWVEDIDVIVPMATSLRSYENRGFELTEELADELGLRLCLPVVDAFEVDPEAESTHHLSGYEQRAKSLDGSLRLKAVSSPELRAAGAALVLDDVVTYGSTFEACALKLREQYPRLRVYGTALAYTETPGRRSRAEAERMQLSSPDA
jgi:predicted amidophosphoribosyltransferase